MRLLVFTRTKHGADRLSRQLEREGIRTAALHGNKSQSARTRALDDFKQGRIQVLVATDIAARGLDIVQLPRVVNYELPHVLEDYSSDRSHRPRRPRWLGDLAGQRGRDAASARHPAAAGPQIAVVGGRRIRAQPREAGAGTGRGPFGRRAPPPRSPRRWSIDRRTAGRSPARPPGNDGARCVPAAK
ncbi:MAG: helicase-related protein [Candidatus Competibacteraceae bacterium]